MYRFVTQSVWEVYGKHRENVEEERVDIEEEGQGDGHDEVREKYRRYCCCALDGTRRARWQVNVLGVVMASVHNT